MVPAKWCADMSEAVGAHVRVLVAIRSFQACSFFLFFLSLFLSFSPASEPKKYLHTYVNKLISNKLIYIRSLQWQGDYFSILRAHGVAESKETKPPQTKAVDEPRATRRSGGKGGGVEGRPTAAQMSYCLRLAQERATGLPAAVLAERHSCSRFISHLLSLPVVHSIPHSASSPAGLSLYT